ncbi:hypothetical protein [Hoeflea sp.]|uniref:hypothetical protein n=1 Tax=Hoeflea sp. TaxID=1940281 RepID=UPI0019950ADE|nr:hypothetical protein [Hoeflea sp.]MBC7280034.1 hypothetical protein [Hoeflea sp.]
MASVDTKSGPAPKPAPKPENADPIKALVHAFHDEGVSDAARAAARKEFSAISDGGRAWEQLPSGLKSAARADMRRLRDAGKANDDTGYSARTAAQLLRDIGKA